MNFGVDFMLDSDMFVLITKNHLKFYVCVCVCLSFYINDIILGMQLNLLRLFFNLQY